VLDHSDKIAAVCFRSDGKEIAVSTTKGEVYFWELEFASIKGLLDVGKDLKAGRGEKEQVEAKNRFSSKFLKTMAYTVDGEWLIGGGASKNICIYDLVFFWWLKILET
jgi:periodic tryptophan protein 2